MKRRMRMFFTWASTALLLLAPATLGAQTETPAEMLAELSQITGWKIKKPVPQDTMSRDELKSYFEKRMGEMVDPEEIRIEELTLKRFGLVPRTFNLKESTLDLMTEQAAAFYDYKKDRMVMLDGQGSLMQGIALVHELAHALADQQVDLDKYIRRSNQSDDAVLARQAVMEGQATWLMSEFMARKAGMSLRTSQGLVDMMGRMAGAGAGQFPVFDQSPVYMRESLLFPYAEGLKFQQAVVVKLGQAGFTTVFTTPPQTTQEILHPERYLERIASSRVQPDVTLPQPEGGKNWNKGWKSLGEGTAGEFDHKMLLRIYAKESEALAEDWVAGRYDLHEEKKTGRVVLRYASVWASEEAAAKFFESYRAVLQGKSEKCEFAGGAGGVWTGSNTDGRFVVKLSGSTVTSIEGLALPAKR
jgi:hypothetical protein